MKDAKGHGSNPRGTVAGYAGRDQLGRTYTQAIRDHDRFPAQNPNMPNAEDYKTPGSGGGGVSFNVDPKTGTTPAQRAIASREMFGTGHAKVARIAQQHGIQGGPFKVQALDLKLAGGQPFKTVKSFRNNTVAEHVAKYMRVDGAHTRLR